MSQAKQKIRAEVRRISACVECIEDWTKDSFPGLTEDDCQEIVAECDEMIKLATKITGLAYAEERKLIAERKERQVR